jgi:hypothetical protein
VVSAPWRAMNVMAFLPGRTEASSSTCIVSCLLRNRLGPDATFLVGGAIGLLGTAWSWLRVKG